MDPFIGEIRALPYNFVPQDWALCNGALIQIGQNTALYSLLGTQFGGDGVSTFGLPNMTERCAIGSGQGPGLSFRQQGEPVGSPTVTLDVSEMPSHSHEVNAATVSGTYEEPSASRVLAKGPQSGFSTLKFYTSVAPDAPLSPLAIGAVGEDSHMRTGSRRCTWAIS